LKPGSTLIDHPVFRPARTSPAHDSRGEDHVAYDAQPAVGVMQALASMKYGMWFARSAEFMQTPITETLRSARCRQRERPRPNGVYSTSARAVHD